MKKAFTLVELIMVLVIIGLLASIIIPKFAEQSDAAKIAETKANLEKLRLAIELFYSNNGRYPGMLNGSWEGHPQFESDLVNGKYLSKIPNNAFFETDSDFENPVGRRLQCSDEYLNNLENPTEAWYFIPTTGYIFPALSNELLPKGESWCDL